MAKTHLVERRKHKRFLAQEGTFVSLKTDARKLWQIIDISKGGLAFRYVVSGNELTECSELDIYTRDVLFTVEDIPFKAVSDIELTNERRLAYFPLRRQGVEFGELMNKQILQLEFFIRNYTKSEDL